MNKISTFFVLIILVSLISIFIFMLYKKDERQLKINYVWEHYKKTFISTDGRVMDLQRNNLTTSEGQSYGLLRAVMADDKKTFSKIYQWTTKNLKRENDNLFSWLWDEEVKDKNSASDADIDIAYALVIASKKWDKPKYLEQAKKIIKDIYKYETKIVHFKRVLMPGAAQVNSDIVELNPSYFAPYAFRVFDKIDKENNWMELVDSSYYYALESIKLTKTGLVPNWFYVDNKGKAYIDNKSEKSDFSYDAIRTFIRFYLDSAIYKHNKGNKILDGSTVFIDRWNKDNKFYTNYKYNGELRDNVEYIGSIALLLPIIEKYNPHVADDVYEQKIKKEYNGFGGWQDGENYYAHNLIWFGLGFYKCDKKIINYLRRI